ncbi:MAG: protein kinase [Deltaproteobacteria bacterium]|nr:protein kinase [Deltaproteobacteria bacterium]
MTEEEQNKNPDSETSQNNEDYSSYPRIQALGSKERLIPAYLCKNPFKEDSQVVERRFGSVFSSQIPDLVDAYLNNLGRLSHPYLAPVMDVAWEGEEAFLVRPYLAGSSLQKLQAKLSLSQKLEIFYQIFSAIAYLETQGSPHLNLHPENIILLQDEAGKLRTKVTDFGIQSLLHRLNPGEVESLGRPPYANPDYVLKPHAASIYDIYSLGILLYEALSGQLPFSAASPSEIIQKQLHEKLTPLKNIKTEVPQELSQLIDQLCSRDSHTRFYSVSDAFKAFCQVAEKITALSFEVPILPFADTTSFFRLQEVQAWFQQLLIGGGRWAFIGPSGSGKTFLARALQRHLNANQQMVRFIDGKQLASLEGDAFLKPGEIVFVIVDDADQGPTAAWLEAHPYQHWIVLGEKLSWATKEKNWRRFELKELSSQQSQAAFEDLGLKGHPKLVFKWPLDLVRQSQALSQQQILKFQQGQFLWEEKQAHVTFAKIQQGLAKGIGEIEFYVPKQWQTLIALMSLINIPLDIKVLSDLLNIEIEALRDLLSYATTQGFMKRRLLMGNEFYQISHSLSGNYSKYISLELFKLLLTKIQETSLAKAGWQAFEKYFPEQNWIQDPELTLLANRFLTESGQSKQVFQYLKANFVKILPTAKLKAEAYEILGDALRNSDKHPQADAALKQAFSAYRNLQDLEGQTRVLLKFGQFYVSQKDAQKAVKFLEQASTIAKKCPQDSPFSGQVALAIGEFYYHNHDHKTAMPYYDTAIEELFRLQNYSKLAKAYMDYAQMLFQEGDQISSNYFIHEMLTLAQFRDLYAIAAEGFLLMSRLSSNENNQTRILERISEAIAMLVHCNEPVLMAEALIERSYLYEFNREATLAQKDISQAMQILKVHHAAQWIGPAQLVLGKFLRRDIEKYPQAIKHFTLAKKHYPQAASQKWAWECDYELGEIANSQGRPADAQKHYQDAMKALQEYLSDLGSEAKSQFLEDGKLDRLKAALK